MRRGIEESAATGLELQTFDVLCCCGIFSGDEFGQKLKKVFTLFFFAKEMHETSEAPNMGNAFLKL